MTVRFSSTHIHKKSSAFAGLRSTVLTMMPRLQQKGQWNRLLAVTFVLVLITPSIAGTKMEPYPQDFLITMYYSPQRGQCCYATGGYTAEIVLNGEGKAGADGTAVYPGMVAAPPSYAFGTRIKLPGVGIVSVHDRGGAIKEQGNVHRLDIWSGYGEDGLARALAFGVQTIKGTVYPPAFRQPPERFSFDKLPAPFAELEHYLLDGTNLIAMEPKKGDRSMSAKFLQQKLAERGYFNRSATGLYGEDTEAALAAFIRDYQLGESAEKLTPKTAAYLLASLQRKEARDPIRSHINETADASAIKEAQRILRALGYYRGRTHGRYDQNLADAILKFQKQYALAGDHTSPGAGTIGPLTMKQLRAHWDRHLVSKHANMKLLRRQVQDRLIDKNRVIARFLQEGHSGPQVRLLQSLLAERGYFPAKKVNGNFGPLTHEAVIAYQLDRKIIASAKHEAAGIVGPATLATLRNEEFNRVYDLVRSEGLRVL